MFNISFNDLVELKPTKVGFEHSSDCALSPFYKDTVDC